MDEGPWSKDVFWLLIPKVDGVRSTKGEYIDINLKAKDRLFIRYIPISDSGVELERVRSDVTLWRVHTAPLGVLDSQREMKALIERFVESSPFKDRVKSIWDGKQITKRLA